MRNSGEKFAVKKDVTKLQSWANNNERVFDTSKCSIVHLRPDADYPNSLSNSILKISQFEISRNLGTLWSEILLWDKKIPIQRTLNWYRWDAFFVSLTAEFTIHPSTVLFVFI